MNPTSVQKVRHGLFVLVIATIVALPTVALPMLLAQTADTALTAHVYACEVPGGGC